MDGNPNKELEGYVTIETLVRRFKEQGHKPVSDDALLDLFNFIKAELKERGIYP